MVKVYKMQAEETLDWVRNDGVLLATYPLDHPATINPKFPKAYIMIEDKNVTSDTMYFVMFCVARRSGSYEWLADGDFGKYFPTTEEAKQYAEARVSA